MKYIVDTNVPIKASNLNPLNILDKKCSLSCLSFIKKLMQSTDVVVLDSGNEILKEYQNNFPSWGQDTIATIFLRWVLRNLTLRDGGQVELYPITKTAEGVYEEYPCSQNFATFDPSDKKFIALSNAHPDRPPIVEGSDSLWWGYREVFKNADIHIIFLCEEYVRSKYEENHDD